MVWFTDGVEGQYAMALAGWVVMGLELPICIARLIVRWKWNQRWKASDITILCGEALMISMQIMVIVEMVHKRPSDPSAPTPIEERGRSILLIFAELFFYRSDRIAIGLGILACVLLTLAVEPVILYACIPWGFRSHPGEVHSSQMLCKKLQNPFSLAGGALALFQDVYVIAIPIHRVSKLNIPSHKNRGLVYANLSVGGLAIGISTFRVVDMIIKFKGLDSLELRIIRNALLSMIEAHVGAMAGSLIPLQPLFFRFLRWLRTKRFCPFRRQISSLHGVCSSGDTDDGSGSTEEPAKSSQRVASMDLGYTGERGVRGARRRTSDFEMKSLQEEMHFDSSEESQEEASRIERGISSSADVRQSPEEHERHVSSSILGGGGGSSGAFEAEESEDSSYFQYEGIV
ncbi:hypothetical protein EX30DRAFT_361684 [Ascodesmis nigricans]|uniref:Rhodopsin domain-containing protein n=1 Tax=Ascodesmis nigricans TaxID=341454 RepID=A0A4S2N395_9PEZI|nr:hypothetical protein EX30DRAFT_361684 [Ascodesmis nigricans]